MSALSGKVAIVTGGAGAIGAAVARWLIDEGAQVVLIDRAADQLNNVVASLGSNASGAVLDLADPTAIEATAADLIARFGHIDILVNNAGILSNNKIADAPYDEWRQIFAVNLDAAFLLTKAVLPAMRAQKDGCIINVASWAGRHVSKMPGPAYTTTKHAVLALTHSFNMDECVNGLRACCLSPGEVATPILNQRPVVPSEQEQAT